MAKPATRTNVQVSAQDSRRKLDTLTVGLVPTKTSLIAAAVTAALALAPAASASSPRKGATYMGKTSQGETIAFDVSKSGKRVLGLETALTYKCTGEHDGQSGSFLLDDIKVKAGAFKSGQELRGTSSESVVQAGLGTVKGTFKRKGSQAKGSLRSTLQLNTGETCDSGRITFSVSLL